MKRFLFVTLSSILLFGCNTVKPVAESVSNSKIECSIDLTSVEDDKVPVTVNPGKINKDSIVFRLPRVVQGTYSIGDYGLYIDKLMALDYEGNQLKVLKLDTNSWQINNAAQLDKITYLVNDTYDLENENKEIPFSPAGTNIESNNYVLNLHGFIGYFDSLINNQYTVEITSPVTFNYSSALEEVKSSTEGDNSIKQFSANRYFEITDNPLMFGDLDIETFEVGGIHIVLNVYSPNKVHTAKSIKETVYNMMYAQKNYLGDLDSTKRYDIFLYLSDVEKSTSPKGFGALEHHTSTVVVLPEQSTEEELADSMMDVVSHEFFHIVTPLSVHSEDVHNFDYANPTFSKHLWMYEGITEYFSQHFQVYEGLVSEQDFYDELMYKIETSKYFNDSMSFTKMSENVLEEPFATNYFNVYEKGALIGMSLDILLRENSNGNRSVLSLMKELSKKYGQNKPFDDDKIIKEITAMTYPEIGKFLNTHVVGTTPINYSTILAKVGLEFQEDLVKANYILYKNQPLVSVNPFSRKIYFTKDVVENSFWKEQGAQPNDILKSIDDEVLTVYNIQSIFEGMLSWKPGREIKVVLQRGEEEIIIDTTTTQAYSKGNSIFPIADATEEQIALRNAWLKG